MLANIRPLIEAATSTGPPVEAAAVAVRVH